MTNLVRHPNGDSVWRTCHWLSGDTATWQILIQSSGAPRTVIVRVVMPESEEPAYRLHQNLEVEKTPEHALGTVTFDPTNLPELEEARRMLPDLQGLWDKIGVEALNELATRYRLTSRMSG